jgi:hypothetical protein
MLAQLRCPQCDTAIEHPTCASCQNWKRLKLDWQVLGKCPDALGIKGLSVITGPHEYCNNHQQRQQEAANG